MSARKASGTLALVGGGEWREGCEGFDAELLSSSRGGRVTVIPAAAAYEQPDRVGERARTYFSGHAFEGLGTTVEVLPILHRRDAQDAAIARAVGAASFLYLADGSPLHLRSVLKDSLVLEALLGAYRSGAVLAVSGAGATLLCDPMVDPRGGAYTVGLGLVADVAIFPYHGTAADHLRERSIDLLPKGAKLVGIDECTALIRRGGSWRVDGVGKVTIYDEGGVAVHAAGESVPDLPA
jgi:cyanophycinase